MKVRILVALSLAWWIGAAQARPLTLEDQFKIERLGDLSLSPDGHLLAFSATTLDERANGRRVRLYLHDLAKGSDELVTEAGKVDDSGSFTPDGKSLVYTSDREKDIPQVYVRDLASRADRRVTATAEGAAAPIVSPDGKTIAFTSDVILRPHDPRLKVREFDHLFMRHWKQWRGDRRTHLFVVPFAGGTPRDVTPGDQDSPTWRLLEPRDYVFTPDSKAIVYSSKLAKGEAWSTNSDLWVVPVAGGRPKQLTKNPADDATPRFSPDGKRLAWRAQARPGYESDRFALMVMDWPSGKTRELAANWDRSVKDLAWARDGQSIYVLCEDGPRVTLFQVPLSGAEPRAVSGELSVGDLAPPYFVASTSVHAPEIYKSATEAITTRNKEATKSIELPRFEPLETTAADGTKIHALVAKPHGFKAGTRYPTLVLVHGGPQGAWHDDFGTVRWSPQLYAARGYAIVMPNPRGSTGYGQVYEDGVNQDWGGKPFDDIMRLTDAAAKLPWVDGGRMCALGASYGGFMINWIAGHTDRFRCLVSHAGPFDQWSMYFHTEELWFPEWEMGGTPWKNPQNYDKWSPSHYVDHFKTPTLVTHGELDFRVPFTEAMGMFTALQRRGIESKLLLFPDEGHFVAKPLNLEKWLGTIWQWVDGHLGMHKRPPVR